ncbi:restriction endonuclease subunit S [Psychrobacter proteolyticus]|uniref:Restriction endonuclease subunit S n=1 Tax=Psychrobacter proteolyticus TaxID=147825 RepID=A0ABV0D6S6_9GAMM
MAKLQDIFDVSYGSKLDLNKMTQVDPKIDFVGRSQKNNGVSAKVDLIRGVKPYKPGLITVALGGSVLSSFLQVNPFYTSQNVAVLNALQVMSEQEKLFYCYVIYANAFRFSACGREANRTLKDLEVPGLEAIPEWVNRSDLKRFKGSDDKIRDIPTPKLDTTGWKEFSYEELFDINKGLRLTKANMLSGDTPFIGSTDSNNGLTNFVGQEPIHKGNVITVNYNGSVGESFYQEIPFWASDDVNVLYPIADMFPYFNSYIALFLIPLIKLDRYRFNYGRKWHTDRMKKSIIKVPVDNIGKPDLNFMESYIKSLQFSSSIE